VKFLTPKFYLSLTHKTHTLLCLSQLSSSNTFSDCLHKLYNVSFEKFYVLFLQLLLCVTVGGLFHCLSLSHSRVGIRKEGKTVNFFWIQINLYLSPVFLFFCLFIGKTFFRLKKSIFAGSNIKISSIDSFHSCWVNHKNVIPIYCIMKIGVIIRFFHLGKKYHWLVARLIEKYMICNGKIEMNLICSIITRDIYVEVNLGFFKLGTLIKLIPPWV